MICIVITIVVIMIMFLLWRVLGFPKLGVPFKGTLADIGDM